MSITIIGEGLTLEDKQYMINLLPNRNDTDITIEFHPDIDELAKNLLFQENFDIATITYKGYAFKFRSDSNQKTKNIDAYGRMTINETWICHTTNPSGFKNILTGAPNIHPSNKLLGFMFSIISDIENATKYLNDLETSHQKYVQGVNYKYPYTNKLITLAGEKTPLAMLYFIDDQSDENHISQCTTMDICIALHINQETYIQNLTTLIQLSFVQRVIINEKYMLKINDIFPQHHNNIDIAKPENVEYEHKTCPNKFNNSNPLYNNMDTERHNQQTNTNDKKKDINKLIKSIRSTLYARGKANGDMSEYKIFSDVLSEKREYHKAQLLTTSELQTWLDDYRKSITRTYLTTCATCKKTFYTTHINYKYCGDTCRLAAQDKKQSIEDIPETEATTKTENKNQDIALDKLIAHCRDIVRLRCKEAGDNTERTSFKKNLAQWQDDIQKGITTSENLLNWLESIKNGTIIKVGMPSKKPDPTKNNTTYRHTYDDNEQILAWRTYCTDQRSDKSIRRRCNNLNCKGALDQDTAFCGATNEVVMAYYKKDVMI